MNKVFGILSSVNNKITEFINEHIETVLKVIFYILMLLTLSGFISATVTGCRLKSVRADYNRCSEELREASLVNRELTTQLRSLRAEVGNNRKLVNELGELTESNVTGLSEALQIIRRIRETVKEIQKYNDNSSYSNTSNSNNKLYDRKE